MKGFSKIVIAEILMMLNLHEKYIAFKKKRKYFCEYSDKI